MTDDSKKKNLVLEIARGDESLRAAEALLSLGLHSDAVSRAYYGAFHFLRALLFSRGVEPKTHSGAIHLFNTELVRQDLFDSSFNRLLAGLERSRELADYDAAVSFSVDDATAIVGDARKFAIAASSFLRKEGWLS
ncbi:MAG: HEPN domain-containing protein [Myxococcaceae bacterium]